MLFYRSGSAESLRIVLPGYDRELVHGAEAVAQAGEHRSLYGYLDEVLLPLNPVGRQPPVITNLDAFRRDTYEASLRHRDTVPVPEGLPPFVPPLLDDALLLHGYYLTLTGRNYYRIMYADTLAVPAAFRDSVARVLQPPRRYHTAEYTELQRSLAMLDGEAGADPAATASTRNHGAITTAYLNDYPLPARRDDALATYLLELVTSPRVFDKKTEYVKALRAALPPAYQQTIAEAEERHLANALQPQGLVEFLNTSLKTPKGDRARIGRIADRPLRLLKFWFAGCYPCLLQQPAERELLAAHPDVELVYVAHSTKQETWVDYLTQHTPPAHRQFRVTPNELPAMLGASGTTGAPTYVLIDAKGEAVCQPCPKPADPLMGRLVADYLNSK